MPNKFAVPQFIDLEDKILGPITVRQFLILLATTFLLFITYKFSDFTLFLALGFPELIIGIILAFVKINGMPFHFFLLNIFQTFKRPQLRVWNKSLTDAEIRAALKAPSPHATPPKTIKEPISNSRLSELSLIVNTGGSYNPEE